MKGKFLIGSNKSFKEVNIYADKSSLILDWVLCQGPKIDHFSIREVARDLKISVGLVQKVFEVLVMKGYLKTTGIRTSKKFSTRKLDALLKSWTENYNIIKKCQMWTYTSGYSNRNELVNALENSTSKIHVSLALHSAADAHKCKNTNLETLELYLINPKIKEEIEKVLLLEPQERGYNVLLIEPYYKSLLKKSVDESPSDVLPVSSSILTYLDLFHFPLRGHEQALFMVDRLPEIKTIFCKG